MEDVVQVRASKVLKSYQTNTDLSDGKDRSTKAEIRCLVGSKEQLNYLQLTSKFAIQRKATHGR